MKIALTALTSFLVLISTEQVIHAVVLASAQSATITDENGDGIPEAVGLGFGHPDAPNYGITLVQKGNGQFPYERRSV